MCGRYTVVTKMEAIEHLFNVQFNIPFRPNYNAAPSQLLPVISNDKPHEVQLMRWGLIPHWAKDAKIGYKTINARTEDIVNKPSFRKPIRTQRCLVLANCYVEWKKEESGKTPYVIYVQDQRLFAMAGIWDEWLDKDSGELVRSFSILTCAANDRLYDIHHRMPVILPVTDHERWISNNLPLSEVTAMFRQYPSNRMNAYPVSTLINSPANNSVEVLQPVGERIAKEVAKYQAKEEVKLEGMGGKSKRPISKH